MKLIPLNSDGLVPKLDMTSVFEMSMIQNSDTVREDGSLDLVKIHRLQELQISEINRFKEDDYYEKSHPYRRNEY